MLTISQHFESKVINVLNFFITPFVCIEKLKQSYELIVLNRNRNSGCMEVIKAKLAKHKFSMYTACYVLSMSYNG